MQGNESPGDRANGVLLHALEVAVCERQPLQGVKGEQSSPRAGAGRSPMLPNSPGSVLPGFLHWRCFCCVFVMAVPEARQAWERSVCLRREGEALPPQCGWRAGWEEGAEDRRWKAGQGAPSSAGNTSPWLWEGTSQHRPVPPAVQGFTLLNLGA